MFGKSKEKSIKVNRGRLRRFKNRIARKLNRLEKKSVHLSREIHYMVGLRADEEKFFEPMKLTAEIELRNVEASIRRIERKIEQIKI